MINKQNGFEKYQISPQPIFFLISFNIIIVIRVLFILSFAGIMCVFLKDYRKLVIMVSVNR